MTDGERPRVKERESETQREREEKRGTMLKCMVFALNFKSGRANINPWAIAFLEKTNKVIEQQAIQYHIYLVKQDK